MAIGPEFIAKLLPALDELEARWRARRISPDKAIDFCLRCKQRLGTRPEFEALRQRVRVTLDAAWEARNTSPAQIRRDITALEREWGRGRSDNYRDDFEECRALLGRAERGTPERARVLAVLASVLHEATRDAAESPGVAEYLAGVLDRSAWERFAEEKLPPARPRVSFAPRRATAAKPKRPRAATAKRSK